MTMTEPTLFDHLALTRNSDPSSSHEAAASCAAAAQRQVILDECDRLGWVTADILYELHPGTPRGTWSSRLSVVVSRGEIEHHSYTTNGAGRKVKAFRRVTR